MAPINSIVSTSASSVVPAGSMVSLSGTQNSYGSRIAAIHGVVLLPSVTVYSPGPTLEKVAVTGDSTVITIFPKPSNAPEPSDFSIWRNLPKVYPFDPTPPASDASLASEFSTKAATKAPTVRKAVSSKSLPDRTPVQQDSPLAEKIENPRKGDQTRGLPNGHRARKKQAVSSL
jgi:hypothetical protein